MAKLTFKSREERRAFIARRYLDAGKPIPKSHKSKPALPGASNDAQYRHGILTRTKHFWGNILTRYPKVIAAALIALIAYYLFRRANGITQWAGGFALSTLAIANPEAAVRFAEKAHSFMSYNVEKTGEMLAEKPNSL